MPIGHIFPNTLTQTKHILELCCTKLYRQSVAIAAFLV